jgi:signal recognition particle GTPase
MLAETRARPTTKIGSRNSLYPHRHFTEHLVGTFEKSLLESDLAHETSSLLIQQLKNCTGFFRHDSQQSDNTNNRGN